MSPTPPIPEDDRRQYFRIKHSVFMTFEIVDEESAVNKGQTINSKSLPCIHLLKELNGLMDGNETVVTSLATLDSSVLTHLTNQNNKMSELSQYIIENLALEYNEQVEVDLSGGGIRFTHHSQLPIEQALKIELVLVPEYYSLIAYGKVVDCKKDADKEQFELAITFDQIQENDRDAIIRHIFMAQSKQLRINSKDEQSKE